MLWPKDIQAPVQGGQNERIKACLGSGFAGPWPVLLQVFSAQLPFGGGVGGAIPIDDIQ